MINLTPAAILELQRLTHQQTDSPPVQVRLGIQAGSCADWTYIFVPTTVIEEEDIQISHGGFTLVINQANLSLLNELTIDYAEDLLGGAFRYQNPNAVYTCDCGNSFSTTMPETVHESQLASDSSAQ
ncbi:MAG: iron-sulfur cluster assembly accessory protein [Cyanothece sp. SIO2G6]|nr:iron-sulfur cluster assembly accessory protein [Cyanothece sp. SIO2G6]